MASFLTLPQFIKFSTSFFFAWRFGVIELSDGTQIIEGFAANLALRFHIGTS
jgi:hypothetical protein